MYGLARETCGFYPREDTTMGQASRLHHDIEIAQRATLALPFGLVLAAFLLLAAATSVYDIGKWLAIW